jgi:hypothetical protein
MSADDRGSMGMGRLQEVYSGESLGLVKFLCSAKGKSVGTTRYRDLNSDTPACLSTGYTFIDRSDISLCLVGLVKFTSLKVKCRQSLFAWPT